MKKYAKTVNKPCQPEDHSFVPGYYQHCCQKSQMYAMNQLIQLYTSFSGQETKVEWVTPKTDFQKFCDYLEELVIDTVMMPINFIKKCWLGE